MSNIHMAPDLTNKARAPQSRSSHVYPSGTLLRQIAGVRLPHKPSSTLWDISIQHGNIECVTPHDAGSNNSHTAPGVLDGANRLLAPSLCHAHIHLDKCFLLQDPKYSDLQIETGDFQEAMGLTGQAKSRFEDDDLLRRGRQLIDESIQHGVTAMRAFVEVDGGVQLKCLEAGLRLKAEFEARCDIQVCAFAQLALFSGPDGGDEVRQLMALAAEHDSVDVLGSTPYVEQDEDKSKENLRWITALSLAHRKHLDLHLDYFLDEAKHPLVWTALDVIKDQNWTQRTNKHITFGHCTRLTRFSQEEWLQLRQEIGILPVSFVGLPTSDLFMMRTAERVRGTLPIAEMVQEYGLESAIAVNNVGNAFTPQGNCDPLAVASLGVGLYQAGTKKDTELLYETVSSRAKAAISSEVTSLALGIGEPASFVLFDRMDSGWRCRKSIMEVVYDAGAARQTIHRGRVTAL